GVPRRLVVPRRRVGQHESLGRGAARPRLRRPRGGVAAEPPRASPGAAGIVIRRLVALGALVGALVVALAAPASAPASLLSSDPTNGGVYDKPPTAVTLRFSEPVEVSLGGIRVYTGDQERVVTGSPEHPEGRGSTVSVSLPKLDDG